MGARALSNIRRATARTSYYRECRNTYNIEIRCQNSTHLVTAVSCRARALHRRAFTRKTMALSWGSPSVGQIATNSAPSSDLVQLKELKRTARPKMDSMLSMPPRIAMASPKMGAMRIWWRSMPGADGDSSQSGVVEGYAIDITVQSPERTDSGLLGRLHCDPALHMRASCTDKVAALKDGSPVRRMRELRLWQVSQAPLQSWH